MDLTCWRKDADPLLIALAKTTADQITQALLADAGRTRVAAAAGVPARLPPDQRDRAGAEQRRGDDERHARQVLDPGDQVACCSATRRRRWPPGSPAPCPCRAAQRRARPGCTAARCAATTAVAGGVVHVKLSSWAAVAAEPATATRPSHVLPGLVGSGALWLRGCHQVEAAHESGEWLALEGEPGVGKLAVVRAVHQRRNPAERLLRAGRGRRHRSRLAAARPPRAARRRRQPGHQARRPADRAAAARCWPARCRSASTAATSRPVGRRHARQSPARRRPSRAAAALSRARWNCRRSATTSRTCTTLVPFFLAKLGHAGRLACSPEAMQLLLRSTWPGNIEQLWQVMRRVVQHRRTGAIKPADLPPECRTVSRRLLSPLESMERDAIVQSLLDYRRQQGQGGQVAGHVPGHDLPQDPRVRHRRPVRLTGQAVLPQRLTIHWRQRPIHWRQRTIHWRRLPIHWRRLPIHCDDFPSIRPEICPV